MLEEVKTIAEELAAKVEGLKGAVSTAETVVSLDVNKAIVEVMVKALEDNGYTVTPPAPVAPAA